MANNNLLFIVLVIAVVLLLSGGLTGNELTGRWQGQWKGTTQWLGAKASTQQPLPSESSQEITLICRVA